MGIENSEPNKNLEEANPESKESKPTAKWLRGLKQVGEKILKLPKMIASKFPKKIK